MTIAVRILSPADGFVYCITKDRCAELPPGITLRESIRRATKAPFNAIVIRPGSAARLAGGGWRLSYSIVRGT